MKAKIKSSAGVLLFLVALLAVSCTNEFTRSAAPVELLVTNTQNIQQIDIQQNAANCDQDLGTVTMRALERTPPGGDTRFNDVRVTRYRVSYVRVDGGTQVPASFVRSVDILLPVGGTEATLPRLLIFLPEAINQAPLASLQPQNGSRDPETGRNRVRMDVIIDVFGETLAGTNVSGRTRFTVDFCYNCGGCV